MTDNEALLTRIFKAGETILREGETGEHLYLIISGSVEILKEQPNRPQQVAILASGDILGEFAVLSNEPRSATAVALEDTKVVMVKDQILHNALKDQRFPLIRPLTRQLVLRLKEFEQQHVASLQRIARLEEELRKMHERLLPLDLATGNPE